MTPQTPPPGYIEAPQASLGQSPTPAIPAGYVEAQNSPSIPEGYVEASSQDKDEFSAEPLAHNTTANIIKFGMQRLMSGIFTSAPPPLQAEIAATNPLLPDRVTEWGKSVGAYGKEIQRLTALGSTNLSPQEAKQNSSMLSAATKSYQALLAQNPFNVATQDAQLEESLQKAPEEIQQTADALIQKGGKAISSFFHDPLGTSSKAAKAGLTLGEWVLQHPKEAISDVVGTLADPVWWLVPGAAAEGAVSKGITQLGAKTIKGIAVGETLTGVSSAVTQMNYTGTVDFGQTTSDMVHALGPLTGLSFLGAGYNYVQGAKGVEGLEGKSGESPEWLQNPDEIVQRHKEVFKDILTPPEHPGGTSLESLVTPPVTKDSISEVAGNLAQQGDRPPAYPTDIAETFQIYEHQIFPARGIIPEEIREQVGNTHAVDERGEPLILFRGQRYDQPAEGHFFSTAEEVANTYADVPQEQLEARNAKYPPTWPTTYPKGELPVTRMATGQGIRNVPPPFAPNVGKYVVNIRNPLHVDMGGQTWTDASVDSEGKRFSLLGLVPKDFFEANPNYDGIIVKNVRDAAYRNMTGDAGAPAINPSTVVIVKDPEQAINFFNFKKKGQGGFIRPITAVSLGLGAVGGVAGYQEGGIKGAIGGAIAGMAAPLLTGAVINGIRKLGVTPSVLKAPYEDFLGHLREARYAGPQIAAQFKKILPEDSSKKINNYLLKVPGFVQELSPEELQSATAMRSLYQTYGNVFQKAGIIDQQKLDYVTRIFKPRANMPKDFQENWVNKVGPQKVRKLLDGPEGLQQAFASGLELKYPMAEDNLAEYISSAQELLARNKLAHQLMLDGPEPGLSWIMPSKKAPRYYKPMEGSPLFSAIARSVNKNLRPKMAELSLPQQLGVRMRQMESGNSVSEILDEFGPQMPVAQSYRIHPDARLIHNFLFDSGTSGTFWRGFDAVNHHLKLSKLSFSLFHAKTLIQHHLNLQEWGMANPKGYADIPGVGFGTHPIFASFLNHDPITQLAIKHGLVVNPSEDWDGVNAITASKQFNDWMDKTIPDEYNPKPFTKAYSQLLEAEDAFKKITFGRFMTGFKLIDAQKLFLKEKDLDIKRIAKDPTYRIRPDAEIMRGVVDLVNNVYGVQDYANLVMRARFGVTQSLKGMLFSTSGRKALQRTILAPDWIISTTRALLGATGLGGKEMLKAHLPYIAKTAIYYLLAANTINLMNTGHLITQNKDPFTVELGGGRTMLLDKALTDPAKLFDVAQPKIMGQAILSKGSPLLATALQQIENRQFLTPYGDAPPIASRNDPPLLWWSKRLGNVLQAPAPIILEQELQDPGLAPLAGFFGAPIYPHKQKPVTY